MGRIATPDGRIHLALPDLLEELSRLRAAPLPVRDPAFSFVLSAGERRSFTANTIIRDPAWRKADAAGALRISPEDAGALGVGTGDRVRISTRTGSGVALVEVSDTLQPGHVSLPNGLGLSGVGEAEPAGVAPNELTASADRDPFVGTPWHKAVPARVERA
jgi:anaerobic selenocysteine-containing dehydrogenase